MDLETFSHGQIQSKLWLCETIERFLPVKPSVVILGSWYNILGFMMLVRYPKRYAFIVGVDIDPNVKPVADKLCEAWQIRDTVKLRNDIADANAIDYNGYNVVINCSAEHMPNNDWFDKIKTNTLVCIQSSNIIDDGYPWLVSNPNPTIEVLKEKYPLSKIFYMDEKPINYEGWGYKRFMIIGIK